MREIIQVAPDSPLLHPFPPTSRSRLRTKIQIISTRAWEPMCGLGSPSQTESKKIHVYPSHDLSIPKCWGIDVCRGDKRASNHYRPQLCLRPESLFQTKSHPKDMPSFPILSTSMVKHRQTMSAETRNSRTPMLCLSPCLPLSLKTKLK
jgi:hypothetical protein